MRPNVRIVPDYEVVICPPAESFRWFAHDYPHPLAKWHRHPEYELHLTGEGRGVMMVGDHMGEFEPGCLVLTGPNVPHNWVSAIAPGEVLRGRDVLVQFTQGWADRVTGLWPGSTLHCMEALRSPRWEDYEWGPLDADATANPLRWLGNGFSLTQTPRPGGAPGECYGDPAWYVESVFCDVPPEGTPEDDPEFKMRPFSH